MIIPLTSQFFFMHPSSEPQFSTTPLNDASIEKGNEYSFYNLCKKKD